MRKKHKVANAPAMRRMPTYLHKLKELQEEGEEYISTTFLARYMSVAPIIVRKDFELTDVEGIPGKGYKISVLIDEVSRFLGWDTVTKTYLVGVGALGSALLGHEEFASYGMDIVRVFDSSPVKIGTLIRGHEVFDFREMPRFASDDNPRLAIICVGPDQAQPVADSLVACGVKAIWNFANVCLDVPSGVVVQREVLAGSYALLSRKMLELTNPKG